MARGRTRGMLALAALAAVVACGGPGARPPAGGRTSDGGAPIADAPRARWFLNGYDDFRATSYVRTEDGELFFGPGGERLLRTGTVLRAAEQLLPETIVSAQLQSGKLRLLGASGTLYLGASALGPFTAKLSPFDGARAASASETSLFVLDRASKLHRSVDGVAWSDVTLPGLAGVVTSIAMAGKHGLVTAVPPQLFVTHDDGATFALAPAPPAGVSQIVVDRDAVLARTASGWARFDPGAASGFVAATAPGLWSPRWSARPDVVRALAGATVVELARGAAPQLAVHALDAPPAFQDLTGVPSACTELVPAAFAAAGTTSIAVRCDAPADAPGVTLVLARDATGAFTPLAKLDPGGTTRADHAALALGPDGAVFVGERCKDAWSTECARPVARLTKDGAFVPVPQGVALAAAWEPAHAGFLVVATDRERTRLLRVAARSAGAAPTVEDLGVLFPAETQVATIGIGADGAAGIVVRSGEEVAAFVTSGATFKAAAVPALRLRSGALAGPNGLVLTESGRAFETSDGASSWHEVLAPAAARAVTGCSPAGCLVDRGARAGWDGGTSVGPARAARAAASPKGLRCKPAGPRTPTGSFPSPPRASALDHGPFRIVLASRDGDGGVRALRSAWAEPAARFASAEVLGPGQPYPAYGTRALLLTQTGGVVVARYTWKRIHFAGAFNPIALDVAWLRDGESTAHRAAATLAPYRSDTAFLDPASESATLPEVLSLAADGVHWRAPAPTGELAVGRFFPDRGGEKKVPFAVDLAGARAFVSGDRDAPTLAADHDGDLGIAEITEKRSTVVLPGVDDHERALVFATLGGKPVAIATDRRAGRSFAFPVALRGSAPALELPTQRSLEGVPACTPTTPGDPVDLPWTVGTRRAIRVVESGTERLFVTDRARVRLSGSAVTCATGWDATPLDHPTASLLVLEGGTQALLVEMAPAANAGGAILPLTCAPDDAAPSLAYGDVEGM